MRGKILAMISLLGMTAAANHARAQVPPEEWQQVYGGSDDEYLSNVVTTADSGFIFGGYSFSNTSGDKTQNAKGSNDIWLVKTDKHGDVQWDRTIGGSRSDNLTDIKPTADGGWILLANSNSSTSGDKTDTNRAQAGRGGLPEPDYWIIKTNADASVIQWQKTMGANSTERPASIVPVQDGYVVTGYSRSNNVSDKTIDRKTPATATYDFWIIKLDLNGNEVWQKVLGGTGEDYVYKAILTRDGGVIVAGYVTGAADGDRTQPSRGGSDYWIVKLNHATGAIVWDKTYGGANSDVLADIIETSDGGLLLGGGSESYMSGDKSEDYLSNNTKDFWLIKTDDTGKIEWDKTIGGTSVDEVAQMVETTDGGYLIAGRSSSDSTAYKNSNSYGSFDYWVIKIDASGNLRWQTAAGGSATDNTSGVVLTPDGGFLVAGTSSSGMDGNKTIDTKGGSDFWAIKYMPMCESDTSKTYVTGHICHGDSYTLPGGTVVTAPGVYFDTLAGSGYCDSIVVTTLDAPAINTSVTAAGGSLSVAATSGATYQWINCSTQTIVGNATSDIFTPSDAAHYAVIVTLNGCSDTSDCYQVANVKVQDVSGTVQLRLYPNPATQMLHIDAPATMRITISSMDGMRMYTGLNTGIVDVRNWAEGVYMVHGTDPQSGLELTTRFIKLK